MSEYLENPLLQSEKKANENKIVSLSKINDLYGEYYTALTKLDEGDIIINKRCKFCSHPARALAEKRFEESGSYSCVLRVFDDYCKENPDAVTMNIQNISTHITQHYQQQQKKLWLREYSERVMSFMNKRISDEHRLDLLSRQMEMKLHEIASDPTLDPLKSADAVVKLVKMISELMLVQAKLKGDIQNVGLISEKFMAIWANVIQIQNNTEVKRILIDALHSFEEQWQGLPVLDLGEVEK